ncbi:DNA replication/repair protein RecF [Clostridium gasigenes]|uniref:DNA replication and repair protein RecF n=1 Tax=Clostridium gasigenes TaxID=94869 RepID=A0A1H0V6T6_9CLOT|nr:DNA replication/repair protein RecF [Clostridium gasigenes]MBB6625411.1 DNA replication/repair protein RecF [Clostridium gasigenes]MBU3090101.1 DNA replication/repair protein RecF [Clostridium gasigenes]MBU3105935.1 DNA replication/repair protein RecF [Clostridium gasigenes]MBU3109785.1 DNA replication/repair protein RecF [Clostridium gasigenes]MBU3138125.1 DNA replication/repair protein RecF [Clostridium gasigenes]
MYIKRLQMLNYRNYIALDISFSKNVNVFIGDNAQGKTNILESIYYCAFAKSHRTSKDKELINWNGENTFISLSVSKKRIDKRIDINILKDGKKAIKINKIKVNKIGELFGSFNVVMFSPEDLKIIKDSPGVRRRFIDMELCQLNSRYYYNLVQYNKILNERNIVLKNMKIDKDILDVYDIQLIDYGYNIITDRINYMDKLNYYGKNIHEDITSGKEQIEFKYVSTIKDLKNIKEDFYKILKQNRIKDIDRGVTSVGPHRDDFLVLINNVDTKIYGSQGQQRTAVLTIKFSSLKIIKELTGENPVLLLDDVLSELDFSRKKYILSTIGGLQTIITCTGIDDLTEYLDENSKIFKVKNGEILN